MILSFSTLVINHSTESDVNTKWIVINWNVINWFINILMNTDIYVYCIKLYNYLENCLNVLREWMYYVYVYWWNVKCLLNLWGVYFKWIFHCIVRPWNTSFCIYVAFMVLVWINKMNILLNTAPDLGNQPGSTISEATSIKEHWKRDKFHLPVDLFWTDISPL